MEVKSYKDLVVWQKAMDLTSLVYEVTADLPPDERFGLISQARRAAVSVPANIAEGHRRSSTKDYLRFLSFAAGSLAEVETLVELAASLFDSINSYGGSGRLPDELGRCFAACNSGWKRGWSTPAGPEDECLNAATSRASCHRRRPGHHRPRPAVRLPGVQACKALREGATRSS
jgi:four helix bundle protein